MPPLLSVGLLYHLWRGHTYVTMSGPFEVRRLCEIVEDYRCTRIHCAPPVVQLVCFDGTRLERAAWLEHPQLWVDADPERCQPAAWLL